MNINGMQDAHVPVLVEPTNDPPIIHAPKFIILGKKETSDGLQIFDKQRDAFEFSVGDPDIFSFPGNKSHLMFTFSMEVNDGILSTRLPVHLIKSSEIKIKSSSQWQPLQTFVTISNHFVVKGKGMRFRGTIEDCNNAMQRLFYRGENQGAILIITVNDLGNYGCYPDSTDMISSPLYTEATVTLIRMQPIGSATALLLGSAIILEFVMMLLLGIVLLLFIFKCMSSLHRERREYSSTVEPPEEEYIADQTMNILAYRDVASPCGGSSSFSLERQHSNFRQRSPPRTKREEASNVGFQSSAHLTADGIELIPLSII